MKRDKGTGKCVEMLVQGWVVWRKYPRGERGGLLEISCFASPFAASSFMVRIGEVEISFG